MELQLTTEMEDRVARVAAESGISAQQLIADLLARYLGHHHWFRGEVQRGLDQLERGEFVEHDDVVERIERILSA